MTKNSYSSIYFINQMCQRGSYQCTIHYLILIFGASPFYNSGNCLLLYHRKFNNLSCILRNFNILNIKKSYFHRFFLNFKIIHWGMMKDIHHYTISSLKDILSTYYYQAQNKTDIKNYIFHSCR